MGWKFSIIISKWHDLIFPWGTCVGNLQKEEHRYSNKNDYSDSISNGYGWKKATYKKLKKILIIVEQLKY